MGIGGMGGGGGEMAKTVWGTGSPLGHGSEFIFDIGII